MTQTANLCTWPELPNTRTVSWHVHPKLSMAEIKGCYLKSFCAVKVFQKHTIFQTFVFAIPEKVSADELNHLGWTAVRFKNLLILWDLSSYDVHKIVVSCSSPFNASTVIDGSSTTASETSQSWECNVHLKLVPVLIHKSFRSGHSDDTIGIVWRLCTPMYSLEAPICHFAVSGRWNI